MIRSRTKYRVDIIDSRTIYNRSPIYYCYASMSGFEMWRFAQQCGWCYFTYVSKCIFRWWRQLKESQLTPFCLVICKLEFVTASDTNNIFFKSCNIHLLATKKLRFFVCREIKWKCVVSHPLELWIHYKMQFHGTQWDAISWIGRWLIITILISSHKCKTTWISPSFL